MSGNVLGINIYNYPDSYDKNYLYPIPRHYDRKKLTTDCEMPFQGYDWINAYEFTWIDSISGLPQLKILSIIIPAESPFFIESKSLKLYLGSFANTETTEQELLSTIEHDIEEKVGTRIHLQLNDHDSSLFSNNQPGQQTFILDNFPTQCTLAKYNPELLQLAPQTQGKESTFFKYEMQIFRTICLENNQTNWGVVELSWLGKALLPESLYQYLLGYRSEHQFNEHTIEKIFCDLYALLRPESLRVQGFFKRRGGIDINPCRSLFAETPFFRRLPRH